MILDPRVAGTSPTRSRRCSRTSGDDDDGRHQARAPRVGARDRHQAVRATRARRAPSCAALRRQVAEIAARPRPHDRLGRHAPVRALGGPADLRPPALPRPDRRAALRRAPGGHLRPARPRRDRRRRQGHPRRQRDARARRRCCSRCRPTRRSGAAQATGPGLHADADLPRSSRASACRPPTRTGTTSSSGSASWSTPSAIEDYTYLWYDVRPHPNFGTVEIRAMDAQTRVEHTLGAGGADPGDGQGARRALRGRRASSPTTPTRCSTRTAGSPPATASTASSSTSRASSGSPTKALARRLLRPAARARAGPRLGRRARGHRRPARARQRRAPPAGRLRGQPRPPRGRARDRGRHAPRSRTPLARSA